MFGNGYTVLKFKERECMYTNSTRSCTYDPVNETAYSYSWWRFVERINGELIFNNYSYSSQTNAHQSAVQDILRSMNKEYRIVDAPQGLNNLTDSWLVYYNMACKLEVEMSRPRSQFEKNMKRLNADCSRELSFNELQFKMAELEAIGCKPPSECEQKRIRDKYFKEEADAIEFRRKQKENLNNTINLTLDEVLQKGT